MKQQRGFSIVMAIFILVVLSLLGGYMVKLSGVQNATATNAVQAARAYQVARAGIEWSIAKVMGNCGATPNLTALTNLNGFDIKVEFVSGSPTSFSEGDTDFWFYKIKSKSEFGSYSNAGYISRTVEMSMFCEN